MPHRPKINCDAGPGPGRVQLIDQVDPTGMALPGGAALSNSSLAFVMNAAVSGSDVLVNNDPWNAIHPPRVKGLQSVREVVSVPICSITP